MLESIDQLTFVAPENGRFQKGKIMIPTHPFSGGEKCFRFREGYTYPQGGPLAVINGVITPINGFING